MSGSFGQELWEQALQRLEPVLGAETVHTWLQPARVRHIDGKSVTLEVPNLFYKHWLASNYRAQIEAILRELFEENIDLQFVVADAPSADAPSSGIMVPPVESFADGFPAPVGRPAGLGLQIFPKASMLNPKYTFENFVVGESNRFAHAACRQVADPASKAYNPLFLYGGVGLGKTHLMHAIGHQFLRANPNLRVLYVTSEQFMNSFIESISQGKQVEFREHYRNMDLLMIDDVQFFSGKERTQTEFFHTFNALYDAGKKIVISSDRPPNELHTLEDRLRNRFAWGLVVDIQPPDLETRIAILKKKSAATGDGELPTDVAVYIAERVQSNIRELEGVLIRLKAFAAIHNQPITLEMARHVLGDLISAPKSRAVDIEEVIEVVCQCFEIKRSELLGPSRQKRYAMPRHIAQYLARQYTRLSYPEIAERFGRRDHTSVLHACRKIATQMENDENLKNLITHLSKQLQREER